jgi:two-component system, OmpR family, response regulator VicR
MEGVLTKTTKPKKVMIVEDDLSLNDAFSILLDKIGYDVIKAFNGKEALDLLQEQSPDIILLDLLMPVMSGKEFLVKYKNIEKIPIVILSNLDAKDEIEEVLELGATKYMLKAWATPTELMKLIDETAK